MESFVYPQEESDLIKHVTRVGVKGQWTKDTASLVFKTEERATAIGVEKATLTFNRGTKSLRIEGDEVFLRKFNRAALYYDDPLANFDREELPDRIIDDLFLGSHYSALNVLALQERNVTHILTAGKGLSMPHKDKFKYKYIDIMDWEEEDMFQHLESCMEFIEEGRQNGAVLIHCAAGVSRSSTIVIAYLMKLCNYTYIEARHHVTKRRWIHPNSGFVEQLIRWEKVLGERRKMDKAAKVAAGAEKFSNEN